MEIISPGGLPPPLFLPPPNSLQTRIRVFMGCLTICLTPGSLFSLIPHEDIFSGLLRQNPETGFFGIFQLLYFRKRGEMEFFVSSICRLRNMYWHLASIRYLPSLKIQLHCVLCIASCRCKQTVSGMCSPETLCLHLYFAVHTVQWNWSCRLERHLMKPVSFPASEGL
jgi:hypothetical protein